MSYQLDDRAKKMVHDNIKREKCKMKPALTPRGEATGYPDKASFHEQKPWIRVRGLRVKSRRGKRRGKTDTESPHILPNPLIQLPNLVSSHLQMLLSGSTPGKKTGVDQQKNDTHRP
jgi:hypothetical protein